MNRRGQLVLISLTALPFFLGMSSCQDRSPPSAGQAIGLALAFKNYPPGEREAAPLIERLEREGLAKDEEDLLPEFKTWAFKWPDYKDSKIAERLCESLMSEFSSLLESCSPDKFLTPAGS